MTFDPHRPYRELGDQPKGHADYVEQDGIIYAWSESNIHYETAWWLYSTNRSNQHIQNILRDRPFNPKVNHHRDGFKKDREFVLDDKTES